MYTHKLNHIQVADDIFVANNHGNQKYSESYQNDFDTWLKVLGIVSNEIYRYRPCLRAVTKFNSSFGSKYYYLFIKIYLTLLYPQLSQSIVGLNIKT